MKQTRPAALATKDLRQFTQDLRAVSDICGHSWAYPPPVGAFPPIKGTCWPHLSAYISTGGLINADVQQPSTAVANAASVAAGKGECRQWSRTGKCHFGDDCVYQHVRPHTAAAGTKRRGVTGGGSADGRRLRGGSPGYEGLGKGKAGAAGGSGG